jgi:MFS transporter, DHA1 family, multidrug resistance protein
MQKDAAVEGETIADYTVLKLPIMLGSLALSTLSFLIPVYAKQLGASAVGIGGLFAVAQGMILLLRPVIGWTSDRFGRRGFFVAGMVCHTGAMGLFVLASNVTMLYLAQLLYGVASAVTWTSAYTITTELATPTHRGKAVGRVDEYAHRGALYGIVLALVVLNWLALQTAWRILFLGYAALAATGIWLAWKRVPETRSPSPPQAGRQSMASWPFVQVLLVVFLSYLFTTMLRPVFLVFLQDEFTQDVRLLALAFLPATLLESFLPSLLGLLSDRWGRRPLIIAGLTWMGLSCICISVFPRLVWVIVLWTLKALGLAAALPPQKALISDLTAHAQRGTGYGLSTFAASLGAAVGPLLGGWVYDSVGHVTPFFLTGIVFLASPGWVSLLLPRR